nr:MULTISPECIES: histone-like nucleoid-structuring protein Lsr2 [unclassified Streptomyces]
MGRPIVKPETKHTSGAAAIRTWARENGYQVADRGRIPANIREAYKQAQETEGKATAA